MGSADHADHVMYTHSWSHLWHILCAHAWQAMQTCVIMCRLVSGTSLVAVVSTALASSYTYLSHRVVDTAAALLIASCAIVTAPVGANLTTTLNAAVSQSHACQGRLAGQCKTAVLVLLSLLPAVLLAQLWLLQTPPLCWVCQCTLTLVACSRADICACIWICWHLVNTVLQACTCSMVYGAVLDEVHSYAGWRR